MICVRVCKKTKFFTDPDFFKTVNINDYFMLISCFSFFLRSELFYIPFFYDSIFYPLYIEF